MSAKLEWFGQAGHFIAADMCRFHLHTHVNGYCVSTVGDYHPPIEARRIMGDRDTTKPYEIGHGRLYETMVFKLDKDGETSGEDLDFEAYNTRDAANLGHALMLEKWARSKTGGRGE